MKFNRLIWACGLVAALAVVASASAQEQPKPPPAGEAKTPLPPPLPPPFGGIPGNELVSAKGLEKLNLTKEQKTDFDKLNDEYKKKEKELYAAMLDLGRNADPIKGDPNKFKSVLDSKRQLRPDYLAKVEKLLTDEQKKIFEQVRSELPGFGPGLVGPPPIIMMPFGPSVGRPFLPADAQQRLKLSDEQKKKVEELQKELEANILKVLTDDQKKVFDELKKQRFGPPLLTAPASPIPPNPLPPPALEKSVNPLPAVPDPARPPAVKKIEK